MNDGALLAGETDERIAFAASTLVGASANQVTAGIAAKNGAASQVLPSRYRGADPLPLPAVSDIMTSMRELAGLLREMLTAGVITEYALFGATAQMRYTEAVSTMDADVLVGIPSPSSIDILGPIYEFCASRGFRSEGEAVRVGDWPAQFIPAFNPLTEEAMREALVADIGGVPIRVVRPDHLGVIALSTGRPKDFARILALLESGSVGREDLGKLAERHGLAGEWHRFLERFLQP